MNKENFEEKYKLFDIKENEKPEYNGDPEEFAKGFKICSVIEYENIVTSGSADSAKKL